MIVYADNRFGESVSTHSLGLRNAMTIPAPGYDSNPLMVNQKRFWGAGMQGLSFDGTGLLGTGLFSGDVTTWGWPEVIAALVGGYAIYSMFYQAKHRMEIGAGRRRKRKTAKLRVKAKRLEEQTEGIF